MASTVKIPNDFTFDYAYVAFSFNGKNSYDDFGIYRTSDGSQYSIPLIPELSEKTADSIGNDGMYYFETFHKKISFTIKFAFDKLTEQKLRELKLWLSGKEMGDLWFCEAPYKVYTAKVTGTPQLSALPFEEIIDGVEKRVYKGTGSVQFVCYWPYAHTPDYIAYKSGTEYWTVDGHVKTNYQTYFPEHAHAEWADMIANFPTTAAGVCVGENPGDLPAPFIVTCTKGISLKELKVGECKITLQEACHNLKWDSKTGLVTGEIIQNDPSTRRAIKHTGNPIGAIPVGGISESNIDLAHNVAGNAATLSYNYWYY